MNELTLAIVHHLSIFALMGVLTAEWVLLRPGLGGSRLRMLVRADIFYGVFAILILVVGAMRVNTSPMGKEFYTANPVFWMKLGTFALVGLLSVPPTLKMFRWRRALKHDPDFTPSEIDIRRLRPLINLEVLLFLSIPVFAAMMARGVGL